jgi:hypothetical protein
MRSLLKSFSVVKDDMELTCIYLHKYLEDVNKDYELYIIGNKYIKLLSRDGYNIEILITRDRIRIV